MKNRKKGFSLVELLIVLAVMAALIATITPVALNAIKKSKATQVAQNLKTLASALENAAYVNGITSDGLIAGPGGTTSVTIAQLGRDIDQTKYSAWYTGTENAGEFEVLVFYNGGDVDASLVNATMPSATSSNQATVLTTSTVSANKLTSATYPTDGIFYTFKLTVY